MNSRDRSAGDGDDHLRWKETGRRLLQRCSIFDLYLSTRQSAGGRRGDFFLLEAPAWVTVVPVFRDAAGEERFLMVRQYRHGVDRVTVEFPAGLAGEGEDPQETARRELLEETGFQAAGMELIGTIAPNPAFMNNWCYTYLARDPQQLRPPQPDELEMLEVLQVPARELVAEMGGDGYINGMVLASLYWYLRHCGAVRL